MEGNFPSPRICSIFQLKLTASHLQVKHLVDIVVRRIGLEIGDRFKADSRKVKFVVKGPLPPNLAFPKYTDFEIVHHYLQVLQEILETKKYDLVYFSTALLTDRQPRTSVSCSETWLSRWRPMDVHHDGAKTGE